MFIPKILLILAFLIGSQVSLVWAESKTVTQSFRLGVTIPLIVGVNDGTVKTASATTLKANAPQLIQEQAALRGDTTVILKSVVAL